MLDTLAGALLDYAAFVVVGLFLFFALLEILSQGFGQPPVVTGKRMITNFGLGVAGAGAELAVPLGTVSAALVAGMAGFGLFNLVDAPAPVVIVTAILARTFLAYWLHRALHHIPLLWRVHRVHHSDPHFDLTLGIRQHPLTLAVVLPVYMAGVALLGLPLWAVVAVDFLMLSASYWEHVDAPLPRALARPLGWVFMTPNIHRVHHSAWQPETDSNFGNGLVIWDRLFGTYCAPGNAKVERIGLGNEDDAVADSLVAQLLLPLRRPASRAIVRPGHAAVSARQAVEDTPSEPRPTRLDRSTVGKLTEKL